MDALSEALISEGIVDEKTLIEIKKKSKGRSFIIEMLNSANIDEERLVDIFTKKFKFKKADLSDISPDALGKFTKDQALKYMCIPFGWEDKGIKLAMIDPMDFNAIQSVSFFTGNRHIPFVTSRNDLFNAINACFEISTALTKVLENTGSGPEDSLKVIEIIESEGKEEKAYEGMFQVGKREDLANESELLAPAIKLVNVLIKEAVESNASDIHIEPGQKIVNVRFRIDGVLKAQTQFPKWLHSAVVSRIKIISKLDISNRKTPQDGGVKLKVGEDPLDLRVSVLPTHIGEKVVIRLLRPSEGVKTMKSLIDEEDFSKLKKHIIKPQGLILITGPTGSGKTTTLHAILNEIYSEGTNIITVEDPVEYELQGITQVQVNEKAGLTFANTLRSILRQDPNVVMVGEIRDSETAEIALRASMTGHLVLSTLHTTGTAATITRLFDIGVDPGLMAPALHCIVAQRLVRINCKHCITEYTPDETVLSSLPLIKKDIRFLKGAGCEKCNYTGYKGRISVLEIMEISSEMRKFIADKRSAGEIRELARKEGMRTIYQSALDKVYRGVTTIDELKRVVSVEEKTVSQQEKPGSICTNCGRSYMEDECPYCGKSDEELCRGCNGNLESHWLFCPMCGKAKDAERAAKIAEKPRVLIVDDEFGILKMVELSLKPLDFEIYTAQNGREALDKAREINPNLVITDINMPVMDGYALIKELRSRVNTMFIPIIILSSRDTSEDKLQGFTYGTDDYITKPFDYTELQARAGRLLKRVYG